MKGANMEYPVQVVMSKAEIESALTKLYDNEAFYALELARTRDNIKVLANILYPPKLVAHVRSESNPFGPGYDVTLQNGEYKCTCPSFRFQRGLDSEGNCKHIRKST